MSQEEGLSRILANETTIEVVAFQSELSAAIPPLNIWQEFAQFTTPPTSTISQGDPKDRVLDWVRTQLSVLGTLDFCHLSVAGHGGLPWCKVKLHRGVNSLIQLWSSLNPREMLILSGDAAILVGLFDEEHEYFSFIRP